MKMGPAPVTVVADVNRVTASPQPLFWATLVKMRLVFEYVWLREADVPKYPADMFHKTVS